MWHRSAQCRPLRPTREQTCWGWPPIEQLPLLSRTSGSPAGAVASDTPPNASHYRRGTRPRRPRRQLLLAAWHRGELGQGWLPPESRHRRPSCPQGRHRRPRRAHRVAHCEDDGALREGRRWRRTPWRTPSRTRTRASGSRGLRRSPRSRLAGQRRRSSESESDEALLVLVRCRPRLQSRRRGVASTYVVFDTPTIGAGSSIGACAC